MLWQCHNTKKLYGRNTRATAIKPWENEQSESQTLNNVKVSPRPPCPEQSQMAHPAARA